MIYIKRITYMLQMKMKLTFHRFKSPDSCFGYQGFWNASFFTSPYPILIMPLFWLTLNLMSGRYFFSSAAFVCKSTKWNPTQLYMVVDREKKAARKGRGGWQSSTAQKLPSSLLPFHVEGKLKLRCCWKRVVPS